MLANEKSLCCSRVERPTSSSSMMFIDETPTAGNIGFVPDLEDKEPAEFVPPTHHHHASPHAHPSSTGGATWGPTLANGKGLVDDEIGQILVRLIQRQELEDIHNKVVQEWRYLALIIDKILFWIFLVMTVACSLLFLVILPAKRRGFDLV